MPGRSSDAEVSGDCCLCLIDELNPAHGLAGLQSSWGAELRRSLSGPWWRRSASLLLLLLGFFIGGNLTVHLANAVGVRTFTALYALVASELLVLGRRRFPWLDNLRLGFVYAVVLEAFKVGS